MNTHIHTYIQCLEELSKQHGTPLTAKEATGKDLKSITEDDGDEEEEGEEGGETE